MLASSSLADLRRMLQHRSSCGLDENFFFIIKELIQPLLEIIRACLTSKDFTTLGERAQGIFKNKLCSIKEVCSVDILIFGRKC